MQIVNPIFFESMMLLVAFSGYVVEAEPSRADISTPRAAVKSFYQAVESGDAVSIRGAMMADDDRQRRLADAFTDVIVASQKLASAARDKFGAAGDALQTSAIPKEEAARIN